MSSQDSDWRSLAAQTEHALSSGCAHADAGCFPDAIEAFREALIGFCTMADQVPGPDDIPSPDDVARAFATLDSRDVCAGLAIGVSRLGRTLSNVGLPHVAVAWLALADAMHEAFGDEGRFRRAANAIEHGIALRALHRYDDAEECYQLAAEHLPPDAFEARFALATASAVLGQSTQRRGQGVLLLEGLDRELDARRHPRIAGWVAANLAMLDDLPEGRVSQGIDRLLRARDLLARPDGDPGRLAEIEQSLALATALIGDVRATAFAVSALARNAAKPNPDVAWRAMESLALAAWTAGHREFSVALLKLVIDCLQLLRTARADADEALTEMSLSGPAFVYDTLALHLTEQGRFGEAREVMRLKLAAVSAMRESVPPPCTEDEEWALGQFSEALAGQAQRFAPEQLNAAVERAAVGLGLRVAASTAALSKLNQLLREEARASMPLAGTKDTLILTCMQNETHVRVAAEVNGEPIALGLQFPVPARTVNRLVHEFVEAVVNGRAAVRERLGRELAALLLEPVLRQAPAAVRRLLICAPGPLHGLPWAALPWRDGYLIEYFDIVRATVPNTDLQRRPAEPLRLLACGCSAQGAEPLPHAALEVNALGADWVLDQPQDFTSNRLRATLRDASVLHLATHFAPEPGRLADSRLLLGDGNAISLREFSAFGLSHLDLLVLSTCESGVADGMTDARAFAVDHVLMSGQVPSVLGMQFPVSDAAMARFMERFYERLRQGDDKARALAAVQMAFLRGEVGDAWRAPFFWAAPVLSGNWLGWSTRSPTS